MVSLGKYTTMGQAWEPGTLPLLLRTIWESFNYVDEFGWSDDTAIVMMFRLS